jgi:hypothetical protein
MAGAGIQSLAKFRAQMCAADCGNRITVARIATDISLNLRADCHRLDLTAATWVRNLANDRIPAPAIIHRQFPCLLRHKFLTRDFLAVRQIRGGLFRPKLYTNGLSWQTISLYYPFKNCVHRALNRKCTTIHCIFFAKISNEQSPKILRNEKVDVK